MEDIKNSLRSLNGNTVGEKLKHLNSVIKYINESQQNERVNEIIDSYDPQNEFEKLVKLRLIDSFEFAPGVIKLLQSGDLFYIPWILKYKWFFCDKHGILNNIENFEGFLSYLSYSSKVKILKKYSLHLTNHSKSEALYKLIKRKYGLKVALLILPACSENFIRNILFSLEADIPSEICYSIFDKYPDLFVEYMKYLVELQKDNQNNSGFNPHRSRSAYNYNEVLKKLASKNINLFVQFFHESESSVHDFTFGRRVAKRLIKTHPNSVLEHSEKYSNVLKAKHITKMMTIEQIETLHGNLLPSSIFDFNESIKYYSKPMHLRLLTGLKPTIREKIIVKNFQVAFGQDVLDCSEEWNCEFVKILPPKYRESWAENKIKEDYKKELDFIPFLPVKKALPKLKELMKKEAGIYVRAEIMDTMFDNLKINEGFEELHGLCDFAVKKHRNDNIAVRGNVLKGLTNFDLSKLPVDSWEPILELINIFSINDEVDSFRPDILNILCKWVHCRLSNNLPVEEQLIKILNLVKNNFDFVIAKGTVFEKQCFIWFLNNLMNRAYKQESEKQILIVDLFLSICAWNNIHKKDKIEFLEWMLSEIESILVSDNHHYWKSKICTALKTDEGLRKSMFDRVYPRYYDCQVLTYKMNQDPVHILQNIDSVISYLFSQATYILMSFKKFFKIIKLSHWNGISKKLVSVCKGGVKTSLLKERENSVLILSLLMSDEEFLQFISDYYPVTPIIKDFTGEAQEKFRVQSAIADNLKNITRPSMALIPLKKFAVGDYLKLVVGSLDSIFQKTPENIILPTLREWMDCPVSLRKHLVKSYCKIAPMEMASALLMDLFEMEKNLSLRIIYFNQVFNIFKTEPNTSTWSVMKSILGKIQPGDSKVLENLFNVSVIPREFIAEYIETLWELIHKMNLEEKPLVDNEMNIIDMIGPNLISIVPDKLCDHLLSLLFANEDNVFQKSLSTFAMHSMLYSSDGEMQSNRLKRVEKAIDNLVKTRWNEVSIEGGLVCPAWELLESMVISFVKESCMSKSLVIAPLDLIKEFQSFLIAILDETKMFEGFIYLNLGVIYHESKQIGEGQHFVHFIALVGKLIDSYCSRYGGEVAEIFVDIINHYIVHWFSETTYSTKYLRVSEILLQNTSSKHCHVVAVKLLPNRHCELKKHSNELKKILDMTEKLSDPCVRIFVNRYYMTLHNDMD